MSNLDELDLGLPTNGLPLPFTGSSQLAPQRQQPFTGSNPSLGNLNHPASNLPPMQQVPNPHNKHNNYPPPIIIVNNLHQQQQQQPVQQQQVPVSNALPYNHSQASLGDLNHPANNLPPMQQQQTTNHPLRSRPSALSLGNGNDNYQKAVNDSPRMQQFPVSAPSSPRNIPPSLQPGHPQGLNRQPPLPQFLPGNFPNGGIHQPYNNAQQGFLNVPHEGFPPYETQRRRPKGPRENLQHRRSISEDGSSRDERQEARVEGEGRNGERRDGERRDGERRDGERRGDGEREKNGGAGRSGESVKGKKGGKLQIQPPPDGLIPKIRQRQVSIKFEKKPYPIARRNTNGAYVIVGNGGPIAPNTPRRKGGKDVPTIVKVYPILRTDIGTDVLEKLGLILPDKNRPLEQGVDSEAVTFGQPNEEDEANSVIYPDEDIAEYPDDLVRAQLADYLGVEENAVVRVHDWDAILNYDENNAYRGGANRPGGITGSSGGGGGGHSRSITDPTPMSSGPSSVGASVGPPHVTGPSSTYSYYTWTKQQDNVSAVNSKVVASNVGSYYAETGSTASYYAPSTGMGAASNVTPITAGSSYTGYSQTTHTGFSSAPTSAAPSPASTHRSLPIISDWPKGYRAPSTPDLNDPRHNKNLVPGYGGDDDEEDVDLNNYYEDNDTAGAATANENKKTLGGQVMRRARNLVYMWYGVNEFSRR